jgi:hypothetical protein
MLGGVPAAIAHNDPLGLGGAPGVWFVIMDCVTFLTIASFKFDSESMRKLALAATRSPTLSPDIGNSFTICIVYLYLSDTQTRVRSASERKSLMSLSFIHRLFRYHP